MPSKMNVQQTNPTKSSSVLKNASAVERGKTSTKISNTASSKSAAARTSTQAVHFSTSNSNTNNKLLSYSNLKPIHRSRDQESFTITQMLPNGKEGQQFREERDQEEIYYVHDRPLSTGSDSATINFLTDDRLEQHQQYDSHHYDAEEISRSQKRANYELEHQIIGPNGEILHSRNNTTGRQKNVNIQEDERSQIRHNSNNTSFQNNETHNRHSNNLVTSNSTSNILSQNIKNNQKAYYYESDVNKEALYDSLQRTTSSNIGGRNINKPNMSVDYSHTDYNQSRNAIENIARNASENVRVKQVGDTTIMTEHRDPYSFYWQLDQIKKQEEMPRRPPPPVDYVIDEEEYREPVHYSPEPDPVEYESQYSRPIKLQEPVRQAPDWEHHVDPKGYSYYWHVDSGTIQKEPPPPSPKPTYENRYTQIRKETPPPQIIQQLPPQQPIIEEHAFKQTTTKRRIERADESEDEYSASGNKPLRFAVRSLGWTEIGEEDLTSEKSSKAVNRAIVELSNGLLDNVLKWGHGRELIMELDDNELVLMDPDTMGIIHAEPISHIRVWGVGRDNGRDFAYVARDNSSRRFLCHVFRCDTAAKTIANALRDICKKLMVNRRPQAIEGGSVIDGTIKRKVYDSRDFNAPIEEPRKVIRCSFIGVIPVSSAIGIEVLNGAIDKLVQNVFPDRWILVDVSIAPSTIIINEVNGSEIARCRVRYLSFLGIGQDIKRCAFIMETSSESYMCYVFEVEPSAAAMAKTIEAACKLRYQKVLDYHTTKQFSTTGSNYGGYSQVNEPIGRNDREKAKNAYF